MSTLIASTFVDQGALSLYLDDRAIVRNSDSVAVGLGSDPEYVIQWVVIGTPGTTFSITISSPKEAQFQLTRVIGFSGKSYGGFSFKT